VPTEYVKEGIAKQFGVRRNKIFVTYQAASQDLATPRVNLESYGVFKPYLMYAGNAYPHKNLERLIIAFGKLVTEYMLDYQLVIVGKKDSFHKELEKDVAEAKLQNRIIFTDFVSDNELAGFYNKAALYVFPSMSEGFGLPALEAMSHGVPVVSSNASCLPEVLGDAAEYFDPTNINQMAKVIAKVLSDDDLRKALAKKGHAQVKKYTWAKTAKQTLAVYKKALGLR
jgi:glycosyltransferase involved in cell wall biosynthesis